jgi:Na+/serine symporter
MTIYFGTTLTSVGSFFFGSALAVMTAKLSASATAPTPLRNLVIEFIAISISSILNVLIGWFTLRLSTWPLYYRPRHESSLKEWFIRSSQV